jgi:hypothetical protein
MDALALSDWPVGGVSRDHAVHMAYLRAARRAQARQVSYVSPGDVARRDRWLCSACGEPVAQQWTATTADAAPVLAYVVPLADRGAYVRANVRLVHYRCAGADRQLGAELRRALGATVPSVKVKASGKDTHCINGHELAGENLLKSSDGRRRCRQCKRDREAGRT